MNDIRNKFSVRRVFTTYPTIKSVTLMDEVLSNSRKCFLALSRTSSEHRNNLVHEMRLALLANRAKIEAANAADIQVRTMADPNAFFC